MHLHLHLHLSPSPPASPRGTAARSRSASPAPPSPGARPRSPALAAIAEQHALQPERAAPPALVLKRTPSVPALAPIAEHASAAETAERWAAAGEAPLEALPEDCALAVCAFLARGDLARLARASSACAAAALDEAVWRDLTLRAFPARGRTEPADHCWRAEYKALADAAARERAYMRALSQGAAGCRARAPPPARLAVALRFSAREGNALRAARAAARAAALAAAAAAAAAPPPPALPHLAALEAAGARAATAPPARQGAAGWAIHSGIGAGAAEALVAV